MKSQYQSYLKPVKNTFYFVKKYLSSKVTIEHSHEAIYIKHRQIRDVQSTQHKQLTLLQVILV